MISSLCLRFTRSCLALDFCGASNPFARAAGCKLDAAPMMATAPPPSDVEVRVSCLTLKAWPPLRLTFSTRTTTTHADEAPCTLKRCVSKEPPSPLRFAVTAAAAIGRCASMICAGHVQPEDGRHWTLATPISPLAADVRY